MQAIFEKKNYCAVGHEIRYYLLLCSFACFSMEWIASRYLLLNVGGIFEMSSAMDVALSRYKRICERVWSKSVVDTLWFGPSDIHVPRRKRKYQRSFILLFRSNEE